MSSSLQANTWQLVKDAINPIILGNKRITIITPTLIRLEYAENQQFLDYPTMFASNRDSLLKSGFTITPIDNGKQYVIWTGKVRLVIDNDNLPFGQLNTLIYFTHNGTETHCTARNLHSKKSNMNLGGSISTLDNVNHEVLLDDGLLSTDGWYFIIDTGSDILINNWISERPRTHVQDQYCFVYGDDFHAPFRDLGVISGKIPMTRKYMHGIWYSRWYPYDDKYINDLVEGYKIHGFPLDILSMDMDWHTIDDVKIGTGHNFSKGWTGFSWNRKLIKDPATLLEKLHNDSIYVCVNEHPHDGIRPNEECYRDFMIAMKKNPDKKECLLFDIGNKTYIDNYLYYTRRENRKYGMDFWWIDWQQDYLYPYVRGTRTRTLPWLNKLFFEDTKQNNMRGAGYSRWGGWGDQRNPIWFSGDATANWDVLTFEVKLSQTSGNSGCYYWAHDIGGFHGGTNPELLVRWTQFGSLSAALRVHAARGADLDRRPWLWGTEATKAMQIAYRFRANIMPYIYSCIRITHETMLPLNRCMFVDYPTDSNSYNRYGQFLLGDIMLAAPVTTPGKGDDHTATVEVWFPKNDAWWDYFTDEKYEGGTITKVNKDLYSYPVYVKGGYVLPLQPYSNHPATTKLTTLVMRVYPGEEGCNNSFNLYEDDGVSQDYTKGEYAKTRLIYRQKGREAKIIVSPTKGKYKGQLLKRAYRIELSGFKCISNVMINGKITKVSREGKRTIVDTTTLPINNETIITFHI